MLAKSAIPRADHIASSLPPEITKKRSKASTGTCEASSSTSSRSQTRTEETCLDQLKPIIELPKGQGGFGIRSTEKLRTFNYLASRCIQAGLRGNEAQARRHTTAKDLPS